MADHESADARIPCPVCGGAIHPIAGRCKHCKTDLAAVRERRPHAQAALPALIANAQQATFRPAVGEAVPSALEREPVSQPILPPRPTGRMAVPRRRTSWPIVVIGISVVAIAGSVVAIIATSGSKATADSGGTKDGGAKVAAGSSAPSVDAPSRDMDVRPPRADDLATYTKDLAGSGTLTAVIETSLGTIRCELFEQQTPRTVANFVGLATGKKPWRDQNGNVVVDKPFYDGLTFHRVIESFMIQGGDPLGTGRGGPGYQFEDEIDPGIEWQAGSLAMANAGPGTNGSQFFITELAPSWLGTDKHTIFGQCESLYVVRRIARVDQDPKTNKPTEDVKINKVTIERQ